MSCKKKKKEFLVHLLPCEQRRGGWQQGSIRHYRVGRPNLSRISRDYSLAYHLAERTSGLARVDGQYVLYMSAPELDVRRHISNFGEGWEREARVRPPRYSKCARGMVAVGRVGGQMQMSWLLPVHRSLGLRGAVGRPICS